MTPDRLSAIAAAVNALKTIRGEIVEVGADLEWLRDDEVDAETASDEDDVYSAEAEEALIDAFEVIDSDFQDSLDRAIKRLEALSGPESKPTCFASEMFDFEEA